MFFSSLTFGLVLLPLTSLAATHNIQVGAEGKLLYSPEAIFAAPGDQVVFHFHPKNHTVTQSSFAAPCSPLEGGLQSGFRPVAADSESAETFTVDVNNYDPIWIYCAQAARTANSHCGQGMVFAINCGPDDAPNSFLNFKNSALAIGKELQSAPPAPVSPPAAASTTAAYGTMTIPAAPVPTLITQTITLGEAVWTTTYNSYPGSPAATPATPEGRVHKVVVGGPGQLLFDPPSVSALPRDTVVFEFRQKNHTVTQSSFEDPCRPLAAGGFDSNFQFVADDSTVFPTWSLTVNDTAPVWAYCRQKTPASHCGAGMVFAINSDESTSGGRTFASFQNVAKTLNGTALSSTDETAGTIPDDDDGAAGLNVGGKMSAIVAAAFVLGAMAF